MEHRKYYCDKCGRRIATNRNKRIHVKMFDMTPGLSEQTVDIREDICEACATVLYDYITTVPNVWCVFWTEHCT